MQTNLTAGTKFGYILMGIISCIAGIWLFMYPALNTGTLGLVLGCMLIGYGIVAVISYFSAGAFKNVFRFSLIWGILLIVLGCIMLWNIQGTMNFLGLLLGVVLLVDAGLRIWFAIEARGLGITPWWVVVITAVLQIIVACMFLFNPGQSGELLTMYIGATFLAQGLIDLSVGIFAA